MSRVFRAVLSGLGGTIGLVVLLLLPELPGFVPYSLRGEWAPALAVTCVAAYAIAGRLATHGSAGKPLAERTRAGLRRLDIIAGWALQDGLSRILGLVCLGLLLIWIPQYLTWPWFRDTETFAVLAQSWDRGILPYRDMRTFNFPGAIYLAFVLGKAFGWGHTVPLYAFDAGCVVLLGLMMVTWSRRRLGGAIPGLIGYLAFLDNYLTLQYDLVAQRDWHTGLLLCLGLLLMQTWPGRRARIGSAVAAALAFSIRPHAVLFLPALVYEAAQTSDDSASGWAGKARAAAMWCVWFGLFAVLAFAPLFVAGILDDLVRQLRGITSVGTHEQPTLGDRIRLFAAQFESWRNFVPLVATVLLSARRRNSLSGIATTWSVAWLGALFYRPIHPVHHGYLFHPLALVSSITLALAVSWWLSFARIARPMLVLALALLVYEIMPARLIIPGLKASVLALRTTLHGEAPATRPFGCLRAFSDLTTSRHNWHNYCELLKYLRSQTGPRTRIANVLNAYPYETINGPVGRLSPFNVDSGVAWMTQVKGDLDPEFAQSVLECTDSIVVWDSRQTDVDKHLHLDQVSAVIRQYYEPAARFGIYEVWRRK